jgi:hypothetical protein
MNLSMNVGRTIAQAVSRWLPTASARVRSQVMWDLWWTKWHWGRFSQRTSVSPANPHSTDCSIIIIRGWYNRPEVADVPSGLSLTPARETKKTCLNVMPLKIARSSIFSVPYLPLEPFTSLKTLLWFYKII